MTIIQGTFKMAVVRRTPPFDHRISEDPDWFIRGRYPHKGTSVSDYWNAVSNAQKKCPMKTYDYSFFDRTH